MLTRKELAAQDGELSDFEDTTVSGLRQLTAGAFKRYLALLVATWPGDDASEQAKTDAVERLNVPALADLSGPMQAMLYAAANQALMLGLNHGNAQLRTIDPQMGMSNGAQVRLTSQLIRNVEHVEQVAKHLATKADVLLRMATTQTEALSAMSYVKQLTTHAERTGSYVVNEAAQDAVTKVAETSYRVVSVWVAESNACLHCLAYSGEVDVGHGYTSGLTYAKNPLDVAGPYLRPPLHPNCRCRQWLYAVEDVASAVVPLKREAARSVLKGWSLPSESNKVRIDAAKALLANGTTLPTSVQDYARRAIERGQFERGRTPPA